ncbi:hypothetical protein B7463_g91, partial [Scytalidium lignicola]
MLSPTTDPRSIWSVDDLLVQRANEEVQSPLVAFPRSGDGLTDFLFLTAKDLDNFTDNAAKRLLSHGMRIIPSDDSETIALLGPSDLEFMITMFALNRLGYTILILSPRLPIDAYVALLKATGCSSICYASGLESTVLRIQKIEELRSLQILNQCDFNASTAKAPRLQIVRDGLATSCKVAFIMHSSGSTGMAKPIFQTHEACLGNYAAGHEMRAFLTVPLYHTHGHACLYRAIYRRSTLYFLNPKLPVTSTNLITVMEHAKPEIIFTVPYTLKILAESEHGIQVLQRCKIVSSAGSQIPDDLGDRLVAHGIQLVSHWGSTETGALMNSMRPQEDKDWAYMKIFPSAKPFVLMKSLGTGTYELVVLNGLKSKIASNSDDPPNSFHTKDTFIAHPTKPDRWKYTGRLDDRVTLINGEKVLPTLMEGRLRENPLIREAVVFGVGRSLPGLLLFRSTGAAELNDQELVERTWPLIEKTNSQVESFAQITKDSIVPLSVEIDYPRTDKGTIIRPQVYKMFEDVINDVYDKLDHSAEGILRLDQAEIEQFIVNSFKEECLIVLRDVDTDFFSAGADSLHANKIASFIRKKLYLGNHRDDLRPSTIFEQATTARLAKYLIHLQSAQQECEDDEIEVMTSMIKKYSTYKQFIPGQIARPSDRSVVLTGATGSLGIHILATLLHKTGVDKVYCLVRASTAEVAQQRIHHAFLTRGITMPENYERRIVSLPSNLAKRDLGLDPGVLLEMQNNVSLIIHNAWAVNFNLGLNSFEDQHIKGTHNLLNFALSVHAPAPARFLFCSSVSVASRMSPPVTISESLVEDLNAASMGYGKSKLVAEHIINNAVLSTSIDCLVIRIGQIVGDSQMGLWSDSESIPLIIRSALTLGCLPRLNELCSWLPVDSVAKAIVELGYSRATDPGHATVNPSHCRFYNVINPRTFSWTTDLLPALHDAKLSFESVSPQEWVTRLAQSEQNPELNPTIKLISSYEKKYGKGSGSEQNENHRNDSGDPSFRLVFATEKARLESETMRNDPDIIGEGLVKMFVARWLEKWQNPILA